MVPLSNSLEVIRKTSSFIQTKPNLRVNRNTSVYTLTKIIFQVSLKTKCTSAIKVREVIRNHPPPIPFTKWNLTVFHRPRSLPLNKPRLSYFRPRQGGHSPTHTKKKTPDDSGVWIYKTPAARQRPRTGTTHTTGRRYGLVRALLVPALSLDTLISLRWEPGRQILHGEL